MKIRKLNKNIIKNNNAVSEVFGTIMLIVISVTLFSSIYATVLSTDIPDARPAVSIVGSIDENILTLMHQGGSSLSLQTTVTLRTKDEFSNFFEINQYFSDEDEKWDIGQKINYDLNEFPEFERFDPLDLTIVDKETNSVVMMGTVAEDRYADLELRIEDVTENEFEPKIDIIILNNGPSIAEDISAKIDIPEDLDLINFEGEGFDLMERIWNINSPLQEGDVQKLTFTFGFKPKIEIVTQLAFLIDGSSAVNDYEWLMIKNTIAQSITTGEIPHNGGVQLTVVQYARNEVDLVDRYSRTEIMPTLLTDSNYNTIAEEVLNMNKIGGVYRPMAHGFRKITDLLSSVTYLPQDATCLTHNSKYRQVINLICAGNPNLCYPASPTKYPDDVSIDPWSCTIKERNRMIQVLGMTPNQDEIDCVGLVGDSDDLDYTWLLHRIAYPQPLTISSVADKPKNIGWVWEVVNQEDLIEAIDTLFDIVFEYKIINANILNTKYFDPDLSNNQATITIKTFSESS